MSNNFYLRKLEIANDTELSSKSLQSLTATKSESTINAYESDWNDFCDWCKYNDKSSFPATAETIVNYINDLADYAKSNTIKRRISAISENYNAAGLSSQNPCNEWIVREALIGISRIKGSMQKSKTPIYWEELEEIIHRMDDSIVSIRDKAILLLGFMGAFRRSEIVSIDLEDMVRSPQGIIITIKHSKTDQKQEGQKVGIPYIQNKEMDCISSLNQWIQIAKIKEGPLFRKISKAGNVLENRLSDKTINLIVKKYIILIGLDPDFYGAHSLRHGFATFAAMHGIEERLIMKQTRHRSVEMVRHYINEADVFLNNPLNKIFNNQ